MVASTSCTLLSPSTLGKMRDQFDRMMHAGVFVTMHASTPCMTAYGSQEHSEIHFLLLCERMHVF